VLFQLLILSIAVLMPEICQVVNVLLVLAWYAVAGIPHVNAVLLFTMRTAC